MSIDSFASTMIIGSLVTALVTMLAIGLVIFFIVRAVIRGNNAGAAAREMKMPVPGQLLITAASTATEAAVYHSGSITGVLSAEGIEARAVRHSGRYRTSKWPQPGQTVPVIVDRADPSRFAIEWDKVRHSGETAMDQAEALAAAMRERGGQS